MDLTTFPPDVGVAIVAHNNRDALGPTLLQRFDRLDILIANAGLLGPLSPLGHSSPFE